MTMETYQTKQRITNRTLTVEELPEEFEGLEVEVKVIALEATTSGNEEGEESNKWQALRKARGIARDSTVEIDEEEWYKQ